jgi:Ser/Thr protein kinase RdoA (MazF antagonist)
VGQPARFTDRSVAKEQYPTRDEQEDLHDLNEVMQAFGVNEWSNLGTIEEIATPRLFSVLVDIKGQHYILRERLEGLIAEDSDHRYAFRQFLQQAGIPLPSLWLTAQGEPTVVVGDTSFELEQEPQGELFSTTSPRSLAWVGDAGTMLARIHQVSRTYPGPQHRWPSEAHIGGVVRGYLNMARGRAEQSEIAAVAAALSNWCDQWEAVLPSAMVSIGAVRGLPEFHIHGDYHALNLRLGTQGVTAVLNLAASRWEKRIIELAYALFYFSALEWRPTAALTRPLVKRGLDPERARRFLAAYGAVYPPEPRESATLGDALMLVSPIATMNGPLEDVFFMQGGPGNHGVEEQLIDDVMERLAWATSLPGWLARVRRSLAEMWQ